MAHRLEHDPVKPVKVWEDELPDQCFRCFASLKWKREETVDWRDEIELVSCTSTNPNSRWVKAYQKKQNPEVTQEETTKEKPYQWGGDEYEFDIPHLNDFGHWM